MCCWRIGQRGVGTWFYVQSRNSPAGDPYLAGNNEDVGTGGGIVASQLTFFTASYDSATQTEYLSYAYGLTGSVTTVSNMLASPLNTVPYGFTTGYEDSGENGDVEVGSLQIYDTAVTDGTAIITALQAAYAAPTPEPTSLALIGVAAFGFLRRRRV